MYDIIIIGGGAAGLMAAKVLSAEGKKILLLEARKKLGGRICREENFCNPAEGGAEFIHGNLKTTFALLKEAQLKKERVKGQFCRVKNGEWKTGHEIIPHWNSLLEVMEDCKEDMSVDDFLQRFFHEKKYDVLRKQFSAYVEGYDAADPKNTSLFAIRNEMEEGNEDQYRLKEGYMALIDFLEKECLKHNTTLRTDEPVLQIIAKENIEAITSSATYSCRKIIIAVPLGVLHCGKTSKEFIHFPGCLTDHIDAAKAIGNGGVIKFLLEFDEAFWLDKIFLKGKNIPAPSYIFTDTIIPTWWTQHPSSNPLLTGWIGGPASFKMKNYSEKKLKKIAIESLSSTFSVPVKQLQKKLRVSKIVNWIKEPYILGGYSYSTLQAETARKFLREPVKNSFYFAGEYVAKNSLSTVDSALVSGKEVAEKILSGE